MMEEEIFSAESIYEALNTKLIGRTVLYSPAVPSTMDVAREAVRNGAADGTVVITDHQTSGRGRLGRGWVSPAGCNLTLSIILYPKLQHLPKLTLVSCLAIARSIEEITFLETSIKWPNDVQIGGKKVSGVLVESDVAGDKVKSAIVGIAVNVNLDIDLIPEIADFATSLKREIGIPVPRLTMLSALLSDFEKVYKDMRKGEPVEVEWKRRLNTLGKQVTVRCGRSVHKGIAENVDQDGNLLLRLLDGKLELISAGDVTLKV
jgi:BirA family biotin operon repressor/biotin-[acetyl-CoA-carboxylase] ligase